MDSKIELQRPTNQIVCQAVVTINNTSGLCMRSAMRFAETAESFKSKIIVYSGKEVADGKSIVQLCMLAASSGSKLRIKAEGADAQDAISALVELVSKKEFDEIF